MARGIYYYAMYLQTEGKPKTFIRIKKFNNNNHDEEQLKKFATAYLREHCRFYEMKSYLRVQNKGREYYMKDGRKKIVRLWMEPITDRNFEDYIRELQWYKENY